MGSSKIKCNQKQSWIVRCKFMWTWFISPPFHFNSHASWCIFIFLSDSLSRFVCQWSDILLDQFLTVLLGLHLSNRNEVIGIESRKLVSEKYVFYKSISKLVPKQIEVMEDTHEDNENEEKTFVISLFVCFSCHYPK